MQPTYSIVIPVYNSQASLITLAERIDKVFTEQVNEPYELIFVDDASPNPNTWPTLQALARENVVKVIRFTRNFGQQPATICGLQMARGKYMLTMDDDLQHAPEDIPLLLSEKHHDVVIGELKQKKHSVFKKVASLLKSKFDEIILKKPKNLKLSSFRLMNRMTVDGMMRLINTPYPFIPAMMFYVTKDVVGVKVQHFAREEGRSGYSFGRMIKLFNNLLINNSSLLLRLIGNLGLTISFLSFLMAGFFLYKKLFFDIDTVGWTSLIVSLMLIGGLILFSLGVIGEYLIRIINTVERRPVYIKREEK